MASCNRFVAKTTNTAAVDAQVSAQAQTTDRGRTAADAAARPDPAAYAVG